MTRIRPMLVFFVVGFALELPFLLPSPTWLQVVAAAIFAVPLVTVLVAIAYGIFLVAREWFRARKSAVVREVPSSNSIQVLSTFLRSGEEGEQ